MVDYIKLQEIAELKEALTIKELNTELLEHLQSSVLFVMDYCEKNNIPLPNMNTIGNAVERADQLLTLLRNNGNSTTENNNGGFNSSIVVVLLRTSVFLPN